MKYYKSPTNEIFAYELDGSQDHLITPELIEIEESEVDLLVSTAQQDAFDSLSYSEKRAMSYPPIGDQLDALYHAGVFPAEMATKLADVKARYPKEPT
jgi:hypothetical protein